jgi:hypothetical protein
MGASPVVGQQQPYTQGAGFGGNPGGTPYQAAPATAGGGVAQLAQALLSNVPNQVKQNWQKKWGIQTPGTTPGVNPNSAPPLTAGGPAVAGAVPQLQGQPALNPQAIPQQ